MPEVHPTARIGPEARLADDAVVGPHCRVEGPVTLGPGVRLLHRVTLRGPIHVGANTRIYPNAALGPTPADPAASGPATSNPTTLDPPPLAGAIGSLPASASDDAAPAASAIEDDLGCPTLIVGSGVIIREGVRILPGSAERPTRIGEAAYLMVNCRVEPHAVVGDNSTIVNGVRLGEGSEVGANALLGGNASLGAGCRVGRLGVVSGGAALTRDLPPFCTAYYTDRVGSLNLVGLRRNEGRPHVRPLRRAFTLLYRPPATSPAPATSSGAESDGTPPADTTDVTDVAGAVARIEAELSDNPLCAELAAFIRSSERGIVPYATAADSHASA